MSIEIRQLTPDDDAELVAFLDALSANSPAVLGYHYPFYRDMLIAIGVGEPYALGAWRSGKLVGMLPALMGEDAGQYVFSSLPFFGPNAGVLCADGPGAREIHDGLLAALHEQAQACGALSCSVYSPFLATNFADYERNLPGAVVIERSTQYLDLSQARWSAKIDYDLRKARKQGVTVTTELTADRIEAFYRIYVQNCQEAGIPIKPRGCAEGLLRANRPTGDRAAGTRTWLALLDGQVIAGLMVVRSPAVVSYYIPCTAPSARTLQPGSLLIDAAAQEVREMGVRYWNWERSPGRQTGVYRFKQKWGSQESAYRLYVTAPAGVERLRTAGESELSRRFPWFFVYPWDQLQTPSDITKNIQEVPVGAGV